MLLNNNSVVKLTKLFSCQRLTTILTSPQYTAQPDCSATLSSAANDVGFKFTNTVLHHIRPRRFRLI